MGEGGCGGLGLGEVCVWPLAREVCRFARTMGNASCHVSAHMLWMRLPNSLVASGEPCASLAKQLLTLGMVLSMLIGVHARNA